MDVVIGCFEGQVYTLENILAVGAPFFSLLWHCVGYLRSINIFDLNFFLITSYMCTGDQCTVYSPVLSHGKAEECTTPPIGSRD